MNTLIWLVVVAIAGVLSWTINRFTKVEDMEWHTTTRLQKLGAWIQVLLLVVALSPFIAAVGVGSIDAVVAVKELLIELIDVMPVVMTIVVTQYVILRLLIWWENARLARKPHARRSRFLAWLRALRAEPGVTRYVLGAWWIIGIVYFVMFYRGLQH